MAEQGSTIIIEELTGEKRRVKLVGSGLPFRPAPLQVKQTVVTTWYNGSPEASQQVLGPQDPPSTWEGKWSRTLLGRTPAVVTTGEDGTDQLVPIPWTLFELFDDVCRKGRRLRVTWASLDGAGNDRGKLVREGRLSAAEWQLERVDDIGWKFTFDWAGRGEQPKRVDFSREGDIVASIAAARARASALAAYGQFQKLVAANPRIKNSATYITLGQLENMVDAPNQAVQALSRSAQSVVNQLSRVAGLVKKGRDLPLQLANTSLALARNTLAVVNQFHDDWSRRSPELNSYKSNVADVLRSTNHLWGAIDAARPLAVASHDLTRAAATPATRRSEQQPHTILGVHVVRPTDTIESIARQWYRGNPGATDLAEAICRANRLPWGTVHPARPTLIIPNPETSKRS